MKKITRVDALIILFLLVLPHLYFGSAVFGSKELFSGDLVSFFYPYKYVASQMYRGLTLHLWDPYIFSGSPVASEIQTALFYPLNIIYAFLPPIRATLFYITGHLFLTSLFMYLYLKEVGLSRIPALFGALVFTYSGFSLMHVDQLSILGTATYLPLILLFIEKAFKKRLFLYTVLAGIAFGLQILAGHLQISALIGFAIVFYFGFKLFLPLKNKDLDGLKRVCLVFCLLILIGLGLSAIALIPFGEASLLSLRVKGDYAASSSTYASLTELQTFLIPELRARNPEIRMHGGTGEPYMGVIPLFLALFALFAVKGRIKVFYGLLGGFAFLAAFGKALPLHYFLYKLIPFYSSLQIPIRFIYLLSFAVAVLSAMGLEAMVQSEATLRKFKRVMAYLFIILGLLFFIFLTSSNLRHYLRTVTEGGLKAPFVFLCYMGILVFLLRQYLAQKLRPGGLILALGLVTLIDLLAFGSRYFTFKVVTPTDLKPPAFTYLKADRDLFRVAMAEVNFSANLGLTYKIQNIGGYSPVLYRDYIQYLFYNDHHSLDFSQIPVGARIYTPSIKETNLTRLLNVKYFLFPAQRDGQLLIGINRSKKFLPRAFLVPNFTVMPDRNKILQSLADEKFDPQKIVLLEEDPGLSGYQFGRDKTGTATVSKYLEDQIDIVTEAARDTVLFLSELYYPGWEVYVDGVKARFYRANYIFRAVPLKAGHHQIRFVYAPISFKVGQVITLVTLFALLLFFIIRFRGHPV